MKKSSVFIIAAIVTLVNVSLWAYSNHQKPIDEKPRQGIIFENEKVAIKYFDVKNGDYDILVETRNGTNVSSEWEINPTQNSSFAYLVGKSESNAKEFFDKNLKELGFEWNWEESYEIEGLDIPYTYPK
ncbi:hypothetical protein [Vagococcus fluvialis]|uniref:hypothetical protein n=1 Tax=Vagococcus fluvialis TaxID=2738 RepID=UPI001D0B5478|nr:hypothetical protein [Vagococcus fluvialis]UDM72761.1 hypothetical protein K5L00_14500 [Vagococcus fluvialis]UDM78317.1 hypothetical protein K5K98_14705 [Vagococcus fluvialis]UDM84036.1 hypothetical protein K5K96_14525 [Vagococcus fluvialis]